MSADIERTALTEGIEAAKAGDRARAQTLLRQVITANPRNELAWFWLGTIAENSQQRRDCLIRVLQINPLNEAAKRELEKLGVQSSPAPAQDSHKKRRVVPAATERVTCPFCNQLTLSTHENCDHCGEDVVLPCPSCMEPIHLWETTRCPCGEGLRYYIFFPEGIDHTGLGQRYALKERWQAAVHQWSQALAEGSHTVVLHRKLAQAYERLGDTEQAAYHRQVATARV